jgi:4'-phosphopantetheinyl transferase
VTASETIDIWLMIPELLSDQQLALGYALMTPEERERQRAFVFERNRREYLVTRGLVRTVLSRYRAVRARDWQFRRNEYGRPEIEPPCGLQFNLSNHPTMVVCAIRDAAAEIGVDVEPIDRGPEVLAIADTVFAASELAALRALPAPDQPDRALALWTLKEAYIKARGMGLALPLKDFAFSFSTAGDVRIDFTTKINDIPDRWRFFIIDREHHRIALAIESPSEHVMQELRVRSLSAFAEN